MTVRRVACKQLAGNIVLLIVLTIASFFDVRAAQAQASGMSAGVAATAGASSRGVQLLARMKAAYEGRWYSTLTFTQQTIVTRASGKPDTTTWYETLSGPARLRIDFGDPALGNGVLYTADSTKLMRDGMLRRTDPSGNPFLPLIMGVYLQPVDETVRQLHLFGFDLTRTTRGSYDGHGVLIVGTNEASDTTSAQFWIDAEQNIVRRVRGNVKGTGGADIHLDGYERVGQAWLATRISMVAAGRSQTEVYSDWKVNTVVPESLFDLAQWRTAAHWASAKR